MCTFQIKYCTFPDIYHAPTLTANALIYESLPGSQYTPVDIKSDKCWTPYRHLRQDKHTNTRILPHSVRNICCRYWFMWNTRILAVLCGVSRTEKVASSVSGVELAWDFLTRRYTSSMITVLYTLSTIDSSILVLYKENARTLCARISSLYRGLWGVWVFFARSHISMDAPHTHTLKNRSRSPTGQQHGAEQVSMIWRSVCWTI